MGSQQGDKDVLTWDDIKQHALTWINGIYKSAGFTWAVATKYWRLTWALMAIFALLSVGYLYQKSQEFALTTTFVYGELHPKIFGDMVEKLNQVLRFGETGKAADLLLLRESQVKKINKIEITDSQGRSLVDNYTMRKEPFIVTVSMTEVIAEDSLREALTFYFNSNPFTAERMGLKRKNWEEELTYVNAKIQTIDSVLLKLYAGKGIGEQEKQGVTIENSEGKNAYELLTMSREMMQRKSDLENNLAYPENVIPIDNFLVLPKAQFTVGSIIKYAVAGALAGYVLAFLMLFVRIYITPLVK